MTRGRPGASPASWEGATGTCSAWSARSRAPGRTSAPTRGASPGPSAGLPSQRMFRELGGGGELVPVERPAPPPPDLPALGVEDLDGIVLAVVDQLADRGGVIPVRHLPAVFAWRDATATFLRAVT